MRVLNEYGANTVTGTSSTPVVVTLGFTPSFVLVVEVVGDGSAKSALWIEGMASGSAMLSANDAADQFKIAVSGNKVITPLDKGFSFIAGDTHVYHFVAF